MLSDIRYAARLPTRSSGFTLAGHGDPGQMQGILAPANYLTTLAVQGLHGRSLSAEEGAKGGPDVVLPRLAELPFLGA